MTAPDEYNFLRSDKERPSTHSKKLNIFFFTRLSATTYCHSPLHPPARGSDIKEDIDRAGEIDGGDEQAGVISAKSKLFAVNENKRETPL